jgi:pyruvate formate lyase activating enzyme
MHVCLDKTWKTEGSGKIKCLLCPFLCSLSDGQSGICRVRSNKGSSLILDNYGKAITPVLDRIQKRPIYLYENYGKDDKCTNSLSLGSTGCNNRCPFCQNFEISQVADWDGMREYSPEFIVNKAIENKVDFISFSFNEVIVVLEYFCDIADLARKNGLKICVKTAGYISDDFQDDFLSRIDVMNLDIKPLKKDYMEKCGILNHDVIENLILKAIDRNIHLEFSHILIEGVNDNFECMDRLFAMLFRLNAASFGVHLLRHYPAWKSNFPLTSDAALLKWKTYLEEKGLRYVFNNDVG